MKKIRKKIKIRTAIITNNESKEIITENVSARATIQSLMYTRFKEGKNLNVSIEFKDDNSIYEMSIDEFMDKAIKVE